MNPKEFPFTMELNNIAPEFRKKQVKEIKKAYDTFKGVRGSIFRKEVIGQNATICKVVYKNDRHKNTS